MYGQEYLLHFVSASPRPAICLQHRLICLPRNVRQNGVEQLKYKHTFAIAVASGISASTSGVKSLSCFFGSDMAAVISSGVGS